MAKKLYYRNKEIESIDNSQGTRIQKSGFFIKPFETYEKNENPIFNNGILVVTLKDNNDTVINDIPGGSVFFYKATNATNINNTNIYDSVYSEIKISFKQKDINNDVVDVYYPITCPDINYSGAASSSNITRLYPNEVYCLWFTGSEFRMINPINSISEDREGFAGNNNTAYTIEQRLAQIEAYLKGDNNGYTAIHPHNEWISSYKIDTKDPQYGAPSFVASQDKLTAANITSTGNPNISTTPDGSLIAASGVPDANVFVRTFVDTNGVNFRGNA